MKYKKGDPVPSMLNMEAFDEWVEYRELIKKPLSELARTKVINRLIKHDQEYQQLMVDAAIENDWLGLHEVKRQVKSTSTRHQTIEQMLNDTSWAN